MPYRAKGFLLLTIGAFSATAQADSYDRRVRIINETSQAIIRFYGSNAGTNVWQEDILGVEVLQPRQSVTIDFDDGSGYCLFDFRAIFSDGQELTDYDMDVCTLQSHRYYD